LYIFRNNNVFIKMFFLQGFDAWKDPTKPETEIQEVKC